MQLFSPHWASSRLPPRAGGLPLAEWRCAACGLKCEPGCGTSFVLDPATDRLVCASCSGLDLSGMDEDTDGYVWDQPDFIED